MSDILCLFAHQDDEYGLASRIAYEVRAGNRIYCVYLTDGQAKGSSSRVRDSESLQVLTSLGVSPDFVYFYGSTKGVRDGRLLYHLDETASGVAHWVMANGLNITRLFCTAWEGGHADHDACHLVALNLAKLWDILSDTWQFPFYNGYKTPWKTFRVLSPLSQTSNTNRRLTLRDGLRYAVLCSKYRSQRRTWLGLFPEAFFRRCILRQEIVQPVSLDAIRNRPHEGPLLYEKLFGFHSSEFMKVSGAFRSRLHTSSKLSSL